MNVKLLTLTSVLAFNTPVGAETNKDNGLDACAEALVSQLTEKTEDKMNYRITDDSKGFEGRLRGTEVIYLDAKDSNNEKVIARYNCFINEEAEVEKLVAVSVDAPDAKYRARNNF